MDFRPFPRSSTAAGGQGGQARGTVRKGPPQRLVYHHHRHNLKSRFKTVRTLGHGTCGKVKLANELDTGEMVAIKTISKRKIQDQEPDDLTHIRREIEIMSSLHHPHIIAIKEVFENRDKIIILMEYAAGGELYDHLNMKKKFSDIETRRIFRQIVSAVYYCHMNFIVHRDLKLENVLLDSNGNVKIADFGLSRRYTPNELLYTFCGSPLYAAPEIVNGLPYHGPQVDCWSLGVVLYTLIYGTMPYDGSDLSKLTRQISESDYREPPNPSDASDLIRRMLTVKPSRRADIQEIASHWWVNLGYRVPIPQMDIKPVVVAPLRYFNQSTSQFFYSSDESECGDLERTRRQRPRSLRRKRSTTSAPTALQRDDTPSQSEQSEDGAILKKSPKEFNFTGFKLTEGGTGPESSHLSLVTDGQPISNDHPVMIQHPPTIITISENNGAKTNTMHSQSDRATVSEAPATHRTGSIKRTKLKYLGNDSGCIMDESEADKSATRGGKGCSTAVEVAPLGDRPGESTPVSREPEGTEKGGPVSRNERDEICISADEGIHDSYTTQTGSSSTVRPTTGGHLSPRSHQRVHPIKPTGLDYTATFETTFKSFEKFNQNSPPSPNTLQVPPTYSSSQRKGILKHSGKFGNSKPITTTPVQGSETPHQHAKTCTHHPEYSSIPVVGTTTQIHHHPKGNHKMASQDDKDDQYPVLDSLDDVYLQAMKITEELGIKP